MSKLSEFSSKSSVSQPLIPDVPLEVGKVDEEQEDGGGSIASRAISQLGRGASTAISAVPGLEFTLGKLQSFSETAAGIGVSELKARQDIFQEEGFGSGTKESLLSLFGASDNVKGRTRELLSLEEGDSIRDHFTKAREWQQNRDSAFFGEKFLSEVLFDPLTWIPPIGAAKLGLRVAGAVRRGGTLAERAKGVRRAIPTPPKPPKQSLALANIPDKAVIAAEGYTDNKLRRLAVSLGKRGPGGVPLIRKALTLLNPAGVVDAAKRGDLAARNTIDYMRTLEFTDNVIQMDIAHLRGLGNPFSTTIIEGNLMANVKLTNGAATQVPIQKVFEFPQEYALTKAEKAVVDEADRLLEGYKQFALKEGVPLNEVNLMEGQHYFPRFVEALKEVELQRGAAQGRRVGVIPTIFKTRLHDDIEEAIQNQVKYFGARSKSPIADMLGTYMNSIGKSVADKRYVDTMNPLGSTLAERIAKSPEGRSATKQVIDTTTLVRHAKVASLQVNDALNGRKFGVATIAAMRRFNSPLADKFEAATKLTRKAERNAALEKLRPVTTYLNESARLAQSEAKAAKRIIATQLRNPVNLAPMPQPAFSSRLFLREDVQAVVPFLSTPRDTLGTAGSAALEAITNVSALSRTAQLTFDFGASMLQGAMVLTNSPISWSKGVIKSLHAFADPATRFRYLEQESVRKVASIYQGRLHIGSTEMTEALRPGGFADRVLNKIPVAGKPVANLAERFQASFETFFDVARFEMGKAFVPAIEAGRITADEVANHINKMTGVISSRALGVSATQRQIEAAAISLAPRWFRATTAIFADSFQGGFRGKQARLSLATFFGGTVAAYAGIATALGQEVKLDPRPTSEGGDGGQFMTVVIGGQHIGLGGKPFSMARTLVKMASDPENDEIYARDWVRAQSAPVTSGLWDILSGSTFLGEPVKTPGQIFQQDIAGRLMPFYAEAAMNDDPRPGIVGIAAEFTGLRSWPTQATEVRTELRDEMAAKFPLARLTSDQIRYMEREGIEEPNWDTLSIAQKRLIASGEIESIPAHQLKSLEKWDERIKERGQDKPANAARNEFFSEANDVKTFWEDESQKRQAGVDAGELSPRDFLESMRGVNAAYGNWIDRVYNETGPHAEALAELRKFQADDKFIPAEDIARDRYIKEIVANDDLVTEFGQYDFDEAERLEEDMRIRFGDEVIDSVQESFRNNKETPPLWTRWLKDRDTLRPYWDLTNTYLRLHPAARSIAGALDRATARRDFAMIERLKKQPLFRRMERDLRAQRLQLRKFSPRVDAALLFWGYASRPQSTQAMSLVRGD